MTNKPLRLVPVDTVMGEGLMLADADGAILGQQTRLTIEQQTNDLVYVTVTFQMEATGIHDAATAEQG